MNAAAQTDLSRDRPVSSVKQGAGGISAEIALSKSIASGSLRLSVASNKSVTRPLPQRLESNLYLLAGDLMSSPAITTRTTETVSSVARLMLESGINGVPALDAGGRPIGMVSDGDLLRHRGADSRASWLEMLITQSSPGSSPKDVLERPVSEVMSAPLITISLKASVPDMAEIFRAHRIKRLPVLDGEDLVGVVSRADLLCLAESLPGAPPARSDGGGLLSFMESLIGGASLRGGLERRAAQAESPQGANETATSVLSAEAFRDAVRACKAESVDQRQAIKREAQLERQRQIKALLDQHVSGTQWSQMLEGQDCRAPRRAGIYVAALPFGPLQRWRPKDQRHRGGLGGDTARRGRRALQPVANGA